MQQDKPNYVAGTGETHDEGHGGEGEGDRSHSCSMQSEMILLMQQLNLQSVEDVEAGTEKRRMQWKHAVGFQLRQL